MPDPPAAPPADPPADPPPADPPPGDPPTPTAEDVVKNPQALIDALGATRDENRRFARRLKDYERSERERSDAAKTELERATDRATAAEASLAARELDNLRLEVALEELLGDNPGIKMAMNLAPRLRGATREELQQDASQVRQLMGQTGSGTPPPTPPPAGGSRLGDGHPPAGSDASFEAALRRSAGR